MNRFACFVLALVAGLIFSFAVHAEDKDDWIRGKLFTPEAILRNQARLKLTDEQRQQIGVELKRVQAQAAESDWLIMSEGLEIQAMIEGHPIDAQAVLPRIERVLAAENAKKKLYVAMLINLKNLLSPAQVAILKAEDAP
jgi:hypothetical protein